MVDWPTLCYLELFLPKLAWFFFLLPGWFIVVWRCHCSFRSAQSAGLGDSFDFWLFGRYSPIDWSLFGERIIGLKKIPLIKAEHIEKQRILCQNMVRKWLFLLDLCLLSDFAPFVAGLVGWSTKRFFTYNIIGGVSWWRFYPAWLLLCNVAWVQKNFEIVIVVIILISVVPMLLEWWKNKQKKQSVIFSEKILFQCILDLGQHV